MAQRGLWILLLCLQTCLEAARGDTDILTVIGTLGESVTFPLNIQESQQVINIVWNSETSVAFVTPGDSETAPKVTVTHQNYNDRINVSRQNYNLEISNLRMEDSGIYKADINTKILEGMVTTTRRYNLQVFRRLGKPKITQSSMTSINSTCNVTLTCSVEKEEENVTYSWSPLGEEGNAIRIFQTPDSQRLTYTCTAWNPVSNSSDSISGLQLCADAATGPRSRHTGLLSGLVMLSLFIFVVPSFLLFLMCRRGQGSYLKNFSKNSDAISRKTIYTYVMVTRDAPPADGRIYDEIPHSKTGGMGVLQELPAGEEPVSRIYSTLQTDKHRPLFVSFHSVRTEGQDP
ncbi:SLAM family member 5 isoform X2 [Canis lupus familiaris]|uniref:SLAM family member 5 isoform X2 n=1 Tax=Canis lupus familiaris TaxID=9615 RepID=UPI0006B3E636|nr:SLAM family member 5 isoform X2 [Canis lupus familiaris]XP_038442269.1 SLAM family member 5 isoform X2 [Canis lupus familiaris]